MTTVTLTKETLMLITSITTTERHTYVNGTSLEEHNGLLKDGFTYDRLARQYRRSKTETSVSGEKAEETPATKEAAATAA